MHDEKVAPIVGYNEGVDDEKKGVFRDEERPTILIKTRFWMR